MNRTPLAVAHKIVIATDWYGHVYTFKRKVLDGYGEPTGENVVVQDVTGIYHSSERSFVELINTEGASVKSKVNKGLLCKAQDLLIQQRDTVVINGDDYEVTTCEPIMYSDTVVGIEISLEEIVKGNDVQ